MEKKLINMLFVLTVAFNFILNGFGFEQNSIKIGFIILLCLVFFYFYFKNKLYKDKYIFVLVVVELLILVENIYIYFKYGMKLF
ncbi:MAG: hypothetical protein ACOCQB_01115 [Halanaerobiaceae bacterium]